MICWVNKQKKTFSLTGYDQLSSCMTIRSSLLSYNYAAFQLFTEMVPFFSHDLKSSLVMCGASFLFVIAGSGTGDCPVQLADSVCSWFPLRGYCPHQIKHLNNYCLICCGEKRACGLIMTRLERETETSPTLFTPHRQSTGPSGDTNRITAFAGRDELIVKHGLYLSSILLLGVLRHASSLVRQIA